MFRLIALTFCLAWLMPAQAQSQFISLCYHDVKDTWDDDPMTVTTENLINHFSWLKGHGYQPVSLQDIVDAQSGKRPLPSKAVLLSFDDGYRNFYHKIFPLLKLYNYPAVFALVTSWMETPDAEMVKYGDQLKSRDQFLSWDQVREMMQSGLIEIASHSHNLHRGIQGNIQGNSQPAAVTRHYLSDQKSYETDADFEQRIAEDIATSIRIIQQRTGKKPRAIVWPYGAYSREINQIAARYDLSISLVLDNGLNRLNSGGVIKRHLLTDNPDINDFVYQLNHLDEREPIRVAHVDLDYVYDDDPAQTDVNLGQLLDRIKAMRINTVYLQAFSDPDGDGNADALYFPNRHLPVRADLFNRVAWQLKTRSEVNVYAWLPVLSFRAELPDAWWVHERESDRIRISQNDYRRLSPFHREAQRWIEEIYQDLGKYSHFAGLIYHDDAFLTDHEDFSPAAIAQLHSLNAAQRLQAKIAALSELTDDLTERVRYYRPTIKTARNMYASIIMEPASQEWFAQSFSDFLQHYDYVALMAMPYMEQAEKPRAWLRQLVRKVKSLHPDALKRTVFELQTVDWRNQQKIDDNELRYQMQLLQNNHALNYGYYPDDFLIDKPALKMLKEMMTIEIYPYGI